MDTLFAILDFLLRPYILPLLLYGPFLLWTGVNEYYQAAIFSTDKAPIVYDLVRTQELRTMYNALADQAQLARSTPTVPVFKVRETKEINGWYDGKHIAVSSALVEYATPEITEGVIAHEIGHHVFRSHQPEEKLSEWGMFMNFLHTGVGSTVFTIASFPIIAVASEFFKVTEDPQLKLLLAAVPFVLVWGIIAGAIHHTAKNFQDRRYEEHQADRYAAMLTGKEQMVEVLEFLRGTKKPRKFWQKPFDRLFATHPPIDNRIAYVQNLRCG
tara:strand:- start:64 stop:876 length:813 start_codon:yes stop_codon:yes gene_type:complete